MKKGLKVLIAVVVFLLLVTGWFGLIPGLSSILGADKPKDLGIRYDQATKERAISLSGAQYEEIAGDPDPSSSISFSGTHDVNTSWNSEEMTALLNDRPWKYWPISNVQLRINSDNTVEMSGVFDEKKLEGYAAAIGTPQVVIDRLSILPSKAAFYLKGSGSLADNRVSSFDLTSAKLNRVSIPTGLLLGSIDSTLAQKALAEDLSGELSKYSGKKGYVIDFINSKLSWIQGFFAKRAEFKGGKLEFDGKIPDKEITAR